MTGNASPATVLATRPDIPSARSLDAYGLVLAMANVQRRRNATSTSSFGVSRRENHDATDFYARFVPPVLSKDDSLHGPVPHDLLVCGDARNMEAVPDASVALVVTSPPYFAGKAYETALGEGHVPGSYVEYLEMLTEVFAECVRTLEPGGRIAVNVANLGRRPYRSLSADVTDILQNRLRLLLRGEIVWVKARAAGGSCAWGSFARPGNPVLRDLTERVIIASKGRFDRAVPAARRAANGLPSEATISKDEFMDATTDVWEIPPESATRVQHPAPFPVELPARLIELYTYRGDVVLDPFVGAGTTAVAAARSGRRYVGYDTDASYLDIAAERIRTEGAAVASLVAGLAFGDVAASVLEAAGIRKLRRGVKVAEGAEVSFAGATADGRTIFVDVAGGYTVARAGLRRSDAVWRVIAKAAIIGAVAPDALFVVLTPSLPPPGPLASALRNVTGAAGPIHSVLAVPPGGDAAAAEAVALVTRSNRAAR